MKRTQNKDLANFISNRIDEILLLTGLTLEQLAILSDVGTSAIRSYHSGTLPISVETLDKILTKTTIELHDFFNSQTALTIDQDTQTKIDRLKQQQQEKEQKHLAQEVKKSYKEKPTSTGLKREREYIAYIIYSTDYFNMPKTIEQMTTDFEDDHELTLESGRIYELLRKYVDKELVRTEIIKKNIDNTDSKIRVFAYSKNF